MVVCACYCSTWDMEAGSSGVQDQPLIHYELKASLDNMRLYLRKDINRGRIFQRGEIHDSVWAFTLTVVYTRGIIDDIYLCCGQLQL